MSVAATSTNGNHPVRETEQEQQIEEICFLAGLCVFLTDWVPRQTAVLLSNNQSGHKMGLNVNGSMQEWRYKVFHLPKLRASVSGTRVLSTTDAQSLKSFRTRA